MKTLALTLTSVLAFAVGASAQDAPRYETFLGFTYMRVNSATNVPAFSANGGGAQFVINANKWVGFVTDIGAVHNGNIGGNHLDTTMVPFLFGPRVSYRTSRLIPYFQVLFGGVHAGTSTAVTTTIPPSSSQLPVYYPGIGTVVPGQQVTLRAVASQTSFGMTTGGGLDIKINKHATFRPIQLEYFLTRLQNLRTLNDNNQHHIRYMTGVNFTFGGQ